MCVTKSNESVIISREEVDISSFMTKLVLEIYNIYNKKSDLSLSFT